MYWTEEMLTTLGLVPIASAWDSDARGDRWALRRTLWLRDGQYRVIWYKGPGASRCGSPGDVSWVTQVTAREAEYFLANLTPSFMRFKAKGKQNWMRRFLLTHGK